MRAPRLPVTPIAEFEISDDRRPFRHACPPPRARPSPRAPSRRPRPFSSISSCWWSSATSRRSKPVLRGFAAGSKLTDYEMGARLAGAGHLVPARLHRRAVCAMRRRRHIERERGHDQLRGTFDQVLGERRARRRQRGRDPRAIADAAHRPVITAHPTEARRVSCWRSTAAFICCCAISKSTRWTDRERNALGAQLRDQIELVFLTGDLHLEKPTVEQEVSWGQHFFSRDDCSTSRRICSAPRKRAGEALSGTKNSR